MNTDVAAEPAFLIQRSADRAFFDHGWLQTYHSFSFADYFDPANVHWGALRVFNDDTVAAGKGFGRHPHRDMEIVTYVLSGQLEHQDSLGHHGVVDAGGVQYMSAGTGVAHSEFNHSADAPVHFVQMWVLPRTPGASPAYGQASFAQTDRTNRWLTIASGERNVDAAIAIGADATLRVARLEDATLAHEFAPGRLGFLFVADGTVTANAAPLAAGDGVRMRAIDRLELRGSGEVVLWDVPALDETR
jgi:redox-sensitive bicupin YhaK (pirin superfamily)